MAPKHFSDLVSFDRVAEQEAAVDEAFAGEENPDLSVAVLLKLSIDPKPERSVENLCWAAIPFLYIHK